MARPRTISDSTILEAARSVFLSQGAVATAAEVARRAGVSEASVFKRFRTKAGLFRAALEGELDNPPWLVQLEQREPSEATERFLVRLGMAGIHHYRRMMPLLMQCGPSRGPERAIRRLARFFDAEMRDRRIRRGDPDVAARAFNGALFDRAFVELVGRERTAANAETYLRGLVDLMWQGLRPRGGQRR